MEEIECLSEAFEAAIKAIGGTKVVAKMLWPAKFSQDEKAARRYLANCINPDCAEKLSLEELHMVMAEARRAGNHSVMQFPSRDLSYAEPLPIEPKDEADELRRQVLSMGGAGLRDALNKLDELERRPLRGVA